MGKKTYYDNLKEISEDELFDGLLGYGLFAEKLPPFLTGELFLNFCKTPPSGFIFEKNPTKYINYDSMRNINIPRSLAIPNPIAYRNQCNILKVNWNRLLTYFKYKTRHHTHKISRIHIRKIDNRFKIFESCYQNMDDIDLNDYPDLEPNYLFEMNHKNFCTDDYPEPDLLIGKNYIVKADISTCFPSIYTHSIPWALVTKSYSKKNTSPSEWFNEIDFYVRNLKEAETHGILIGPHASNLISEIILVNIDSILSKKYDYIRNIDDYTCYLKTFEDAEQFLIDLSIELKKFGLILNHKKTEINKLPLASTEHWIRKIKTFIFSEDPLNLKLTEVRAFLDIALDLMKDNKENSAILNYAIKVLSKRKMTKNAENYFIKTIHHLVLIYPYLIPILDEKIFKPFEIAPNYIEEISKNIFDMGIEKKLYEAMSYALFFSLKYDFKVSDNLFPLINNNRDTILMLLAYLHDLKNNNHSSIMKSYKNLAKLLIDDIDEYWLYVYEVLPKSLLKRYWKTLKENNITFIKDQFK